jgi:hypothetical protein
VDQPAPQAASAIRAPGLRARWSKSGAASSQPSSSWVKAGRLNAACAALTYLPPLNTAFQTAPLDVQTWLLIAALSVAAWAVVVLDKRIRHRIV